MIPFEMVVLDEFTYSLPKMVLAQGNDPIETLPFIDRTNRPAYEFAFGARYGVWTTRIPASCTHSRTRPLHFVSRSQIKMRQGSASACRKWPILVVDRVVGDFVHERVTFVNVLLNVFGIW